MMDGKLMKHINYGSNGDEKKSENENWSDTHKHTQMEKSQKLLFNTNLGIL